MIVPFCLPVSLESKAQGRLLYKQLYSTNEYIFNLAKNNNMFFLYLFTNLSLHNMNCPFNSTHLNDKDPKVLTCIGLRKKGYYSIDLVKLNF